MKITFLRKEDLTRPLITSINTCCSRYYPDFYLSYESVVRDHVVYGFEFILLEGGDEEKVLLTFFGDDEENLDYPLRAGVDAYCRSMHLDPEMWEQLPLLREFWNRFSMQWSERGATRNGYLEREGNSTLEELEKQAHNNYRSHLFGKKSQRYHTLFRARSPYHGDSTGDLLHTMIRVLKKYGSERVDYLEENGMEVSSELYEMLFLHDWFLDSPNNAGLLEVFQESELIGFLSWRIAGRIAFWGDIVIHRTKENDNLSLYNITPLILVSKLFSMPCVERVHLGYDLGNLAEYKKRIFPQANFDFYVKLPLPIWVNENQAREELNQLKG
jgi:hypothetical protein